MCDQENSEKGTFSGQGSDLSRSEIRVSFWLRFGNKGTFLMTLFRTKGMLLVRCCPHNMLFQWLIPGNQPYSSEIWVSDSIPICVLRTVYKIWRHASEIRVCLLLRGSDKGIILQPWTSEIWVRLNVVFWGPLLSGMLHLILCKALVELE